MPGIPKAKVRSRIILTPEHTKKFIKALSDNLVKYESINGPVKDFKKEIFHCSLMVLTRKPVSVKWKMR